MKTIHSHHTPHRLPDPVLNSLTYDPSGSLKLPFPPTHHPTTRKQGQVTMDSSLEEPDPVEDVLRNPLKAAPKLVAPEPEHCPGPESETAGKLSGT